MKKKVLALILCAMMAATAVVGGTLAYFTDTTEVVNNEFSMGKVDIELDEAKVEDGKATEERVNENDYTDINMVPGHVFAKDPTIHVKAGSEESYIFLDMTFNKFSSLFWVMAADASADDEINFTIFNDEGKLDDNFANDSGVFSTTKFVEYMIANKTVSNAIFSKWFTGVELEKWTLCDIYMNASVDNVTVAGSNMTLRFAYKGANNDYLVNAKEATEDIDIVFMTHFQMPASVTQKMIEDGKTVGNMKNIFNTDVPFHLNFIAYAIQADTLDGYTGAHKAMFSTEVDNVYLNNVKG